MDPDISLGAKMVYEYRTWWAEWSSPPGRPQESREWGSCSCRLWTGCSSGWCPFFPPRNLQKIAGFSNLQTKWALFFIVSTGNIFLCFPQANNIIFFKKNDFTTFPKKNTSVIIVEFLDILLGDLLEHLPPEIDCILIQESILLVHAAGLVVSLPLRLVGQNRVGTRDDLESTMLSLRKNCTFYFLFSDEGKQQFFKIILEGERSLVFFGGKRLIFILDSMSGLGLRIISPVRMPFHRHLVVGLLHWNLQKKSSFSKFDFSYPEAEWHFARCWAAGTGTQCRSALCTRPGTSSGVQRNFKIPKICRKYENQQIRKIPAQIATSPYSHRVLWAWPMSCISASLLTLHRQAALFLLIPQPDRLESWYSFGSAMFRSEF